MDTIKRKVRKEHTTIRLSNKTALKTALKAYNSRTGAMLSFSQWLGLLITAGMKVLVTETK